MERTLGAAVALQIVGEGSESRGAERKVRAALRRRSKPSNDLSVETKCRDAIADSFHGLGNDRTDGLAKMTECRTPLRYSSMVVALCFIGLALVIWCDSLLSATEAAAGREY